MTIEDSFIWKTITGILGVLVSIIWWDTKSDIKKSEERLDNLEDTTLTKEETKELIQLHVDPLNQTQTMMWADIKEIKSILMKQSKD